jgi:methyltransferase (TIGR00027 family)
MRERQASQTAEIMALFRALETACSPAQRLFMDPFARHFLRPSLRVIAQLARIPFFNVVISQFIDQRWPGARSSGIARTRFIDDTLMMALNNGIEQVVILGAGFDSRAYRLSHLERARVFEVDHPATLAEKRARLQDCVGLFPKHVTFVSIDFNRQCLADVLESAGFERARRTFFIWEGVTNYLSEQAVDETVRFVATAAPHSQLVFTYIHRGILDGSWTGGGTQELERTLKRVDEPWTFGFDPAMLPDYLQIRGLRLVEDVDATAYRKRYLSARAQGLHGYEFYHIALTEVL